MTEKTPRVVNVRAGWALVCVGVVCGMAAVFMLVGSVGPALRDVWVRPPCATPCSESLNLETGHYLVFEEVGRSTSVGPFSSSTEGPATVSPAEVAVTAPSGEALDVAAPSASETVERNGAIYGGVAGFRVREPGRYRLAVDAPPGSRILVAPGLGQTFLKALPGIGVAVIGFAVGLTGLVFLVVAWIRRRTPQTPPGSSGPAALASS